jgi:hypothetical protein
MNTNKTNRKHHGDKKAYAPRGPKARIISLREKGHVGDTLTEFTAREVQRFYGIIDALRFGNFKTGFNTYQHGLIVVDGFTVNGIKNGGFSKKVGTIFGLMKAEDYIRLNAIKGDPALADFVQAVFIEDGKIIHDDAGKTTITFSKFKANDFGQEMTVPYESLEAFVATLVTELFGFDYLPQFVKKDEERKQAQQAKPSPNETALGGDTSRVVLRDANARRPNTGKPARPFGKSRPPREMRREDAARDESFALPA